MIVFPKPHIWLPSSRYKYRGVNRGTARGIGVRDRLLYRAVPVHFDGTNDHLSAGADVFVDSEDGALSFWFNMIDGDAGNQIFMASLDGDSNIRILRLSTNDIQILLRRADATVIWARDSTNTDYTVANGWHHFWAKWELDVSPTVEFVITRQSDGRQDTGSDVVSPINGTVDMTEGDFFIGAINDATLKVDADIADIFFDDAITGHSRTDFIDSNDRPVDPSNKNPAVLLTGGNTSNWHTNVGTGGGFTENGALTDGGSSPSDL